MIAQVTAISFRYGTMTAQVTGLSIKRGQRVDDLFLNMLSLFAWNDDSLGHDSLSKYWIMIAQVTAFSFSIWDHDSSGHSPLSHCGFMLVTTLYVNTGHDSSVTAFSLSIWDHDISGHSSLTVGS
jgi:hypothetical protein